MFTGTNCERFAQQLVLECSKTPVRTKWMHALETPLHGQGSRSSNEELIVEGPLLKVLSFYTCVPLRICECTCAHVCNFCGFVCANEP